MRRLSTLIAAIVFGAMLISSAGPVLAQGPTFGFGAGYDEHRRIGPRFGICMTEYQARRWMEERGWSRVRYGVEYEGRVPIVAIRNGYVWEVVVQLCSRRIISAERLRPAG